MVAKEIVKLPPQAIDVEDMIISAILIESQAYNSVSGYMKPEYFYKASNQAIYRAVEMMQKTGISIDVFTVSEQLRKTNELDFVGGQYSLMLLSSKISSSAHIETHAKIVYQKYIARELILMAQQVQEMAYSNENDVEDILDYLNKGLQCVEESGSVNILELSTAVEMLRQNITRNADPTNSNAGQFTGFEAFDKRGGGMQGGDLHIFAAETSHGKTSLALSICNNIGNNGGKIAIYSLEMTSIQIAARMTAYHTGIPASELLYSKFTHEQFKHLDSRISGLDRIKIYIDEKSTSSLNSIVSSIRIMKRKYNIDGIVVDYLQLVSINEKGMNEESKAATIARTLKNIAKDLGIWVILVSQLSRDRGNPIPSMSRLRNSGQIEEAADVVWLLYRPEQAGRSEFPEPYTQVNVQNAAMIDVAKGRNIGTFKMLAHFDKPTTLFTPATENDFAMNLDAFQKSDEPF